MFEPTNKPYFLWWLEATVSDLREALGQNDLAKRAYYVGALLREANSRDVWYFVTPDEVRALWPHVARHLGRTRSMWAWLLDIPDEA